MLKLGFSIDHPLVPFPAHPCTTTQSSQALSSNGYSGLRMAIASNGGNSQKMEAFADFQASTRNGHSESESNFGKAGEEDEQSEFWKQPDGLGYKPCLKFTHEYTKASAAIVKNRRKYLMVVVSGGMNQQRNQIVDAVVIARILGASLVVPVLQVNVIWGDER